MGNLHDLWKGNLSLDEAFWTWGVIGGLVVNLATSLLFFVLISHGQAWAAFMVGYVISLPYNCLAIVGVWRSAARHDGLALHATLARCAILIVMALLSLT